jgi:hypothetical protein
MTEDIYRCLRSIMDECDGYRFGQDSYDIKLDHIYEQASSALGYLECPVYREHGACCCSTGMLGGCALEQR